MQIRILANLVEQMGKKKFISYFSTYKQKDFFWKKINLGV